MVAKMFKAIHAQESREASEAKAAEVAISLESMKLDATAKGVRVGCAKTLAYTDFPMQHWARIRKNNASERLNRETRRRTRVVGAFPDGRSALMLMTAKLKYTVENEWNRRRHLDASLLEEKKDRGCRAITPVAPSRHRHICERSLTAPSPNTHANGSRTPTF